MTCGCTPPSRTSLWTPIPFSQPTEILPGENIDCYSKRSADAGGQKDDAREDLVNRIQNTFLNAQVSGADLKVSETFTLSKGPRTATSWTATSTPPLTNLAISPSGVLTCKIEKSEEGKTFKVLVTALDQAGSIDSREFTLTPARATKGDSISFVSPYVPSSGGTKINSGFGPRIHPISKVSKNHAGQDWVAALPAAKGKGTIVAAADGEVAYVGNNPGGYGINVKINHKSAAGKILCMTLYGHLSQALVTQGQKVGQGQPIGKEGSTGASTGPHLHFECRLGGTLAVDPAPYLRGSVAVQPPVQTDGTQPQDKVIANKAPLLTQKEVTARTQDDCPKLLDSGASPSTSPETPASFDNVSPTTSNCKPKERPSFEAVKADIDRALNESSLNAEDKKFIHFIAKIESRYDPYAKNPTSSATGLFQMLDKIAAKYYGDIGVKPTCENRCNAYYATKAMIEFYKKELLSYWNGYNNSGKTKIANLTIKSTPHSARYSSLTQGEFCYGLLHHDGVGNAVNGIDKQGIDYFRKKAAEA